MGYNQFCTSIPSPTYQATLDFSHTLVVEASTSVREVDLVGFMPMLTVDEPKSPLASTKKDQDEGQQSPWRQSSMKQSRVVKDDAYGGNYFHKYDIYSPLSNLMHV